MNGPKVEAFLALRGGGRPSVGRERIALLEAVAEHGSITRAAQAVGLSYKAAWDAINAINNLLPSPAVVGQTGGRKGGGATVTSGGQALIAAFHLIEDKLGRVAALLASGDVEDLADPATLLWSLGMKTSARNVFRCSVAEVRQGPVSAEIILRLTDSLPLSAIVTRDSVDELGLVPGREVTALIKASWVLLATGADAPRVSARNRIPGKVAERHDGEVSSEIVLDIGGGRTITAMVTRDGADDLTLTVGDAAWALVKASHVILSVD